MSVPRALPWQARLMLGLVPPALLLAWWQSQAQAGGARAAVFASLATIGVAAREQIASGALLGDATATLTRALTGFGIGGTLGFAAGVLLALSRWAERLLGPLLQAFRQVPMIGWLPLFALWFGTGDGSQVTVIAVSAFFPALLNTHAGIVQVERRFLDVGRIYRLRAVQRFRLILLPGALPLVLTGLTQALSFAWIAAIGTEILLGSGGGLGVTLQTAQTEQRLDAMLVTIAVTAALGFALNQIIRHLRARLLHWQPVGA